MERGGMGIWNAKENGNSNFLSPGGDSLTQNLRNQLNKSGKSDLNLYSNNKTNIFKRKGTRYILNRNNKILKRLSTFRYKIKRKR